MYDPEDLPVQVASKIEPVEDGCWIWTASRNSTQGGYGQIKYKGKVVHAHRLVWRLWLAKYRQACILITCVASRPVVTQNT